MILLLASPSSDAAGGAATADTSSTISRDVHHDHAKKKSKTSNTGEKTPTKTKSSDLLSQILKVASKLKQEYLTVQASTTQLLCTIRKDRAYNWADNPQNRGRLESLLADMHEKLSDRDK